MKKRVLYVLDYFHPHRGGVETVFGHITRHFSETYDITILTSCFDSHLLPYEKYHNIHIIRVCTGRITFMLFGWFFGLLYFLKHNICFDLIHTSTYGGLLSGRILSFFYRIPIILTIHEVFGQLWFHYKGRLKGFFYWILEFFVFHLPFDYYHSVSLSTFNTVRLLYGISDQKHCMIYNGVDNTFWYPDAVSSHDIVSFRNTLQWYDRYVVLYYGHSGISKGLDLLVDAIPEICRQHPDILIVFNLIPASRDTYIKNRIHAHNLHKNISIYSGFDIVDLRTLVAASDVVVAPSLSEGFGSVHAEVSALGKPLITTYYASIPEVVSGKVLFLSSWHIDALVQSINIMKTKTITQIIPYKKFDWQQSFEEFDTLYSLFI